MDKDDDRRLGIVCVLAASSCWVVMITVTFQTEKLCIEGSGLREGQSSLAGSTGIAGELFLEIFCSPGRQGLLIPRKHWSLLPCELGYN